MPNGQRRQLQVSIHDTIVDVKKKLAQEFQLSDTLQFHFGNMELQDNKSLSDYGIPEIYEQAESLLRMIELGGLDAQKKPEALERMCIVVESLKNGVKDPKELLSAVTRDSKNQPTENVNSNAANCSVQPDEQSRCGTSTSPGFSHHVASTSNEAESSPILLPSSSTSANTKSPKLPLEKLDEPNMLDPDDLLTRLTDYLPDLFTPKGLSSLRSGMTPRAWYNNNNNNNNHNIHNSYSNNNTPRGLTSFEESSIDWSSMDYNNSNISNRQSMIETKEDRPTPNWIREFTSNWNIQSPKRKSRHSYDGSSSGQEDDNFSNDSSLEGLLKSGGEYSGNPSHSDNTNNSNLENSRISDDPISEQQQQHETSRVKRRGRKRKHPEMTEEERKAYRAMQNRKSAERSRQRKKIQQEAYQKRMEQLCTENDELRSTVQALQSRLEYLENLLSVTIRRSG